MENIQKTLNAMGLSVEDYNRSPYVNMAVKLILDHPESMLSVLGNTLGGYLELYNKNAELEQHVQQLANGIGHRHDAADAARQRIEELEEQNEKLRSALRRWHKMPHTMKIYRDAFLAELQSGEQGLTHVAESYREIADLL